MFKDFPSSALSLLDVLLSIDPAHRGTATSALAHEVKGFMRDEKGCVSLKVNLLACSVSDLPRKALGRNLPSAACRSEWATPLSAFGCVPQFYHSKPFPCDPSSLPQYPPSKEYDAKLRDEEARR